MRQCRIVLLCMAVFSVFLSETAVRAQSGSGADLDALGAKLSEYLSAIERESAGTKCAEADFLIGSCADSAVRRFTANEVYGHYFRSRLMGDDAVAIHVFDEWFLPGKVKMNSEADFFAAKIFADFNRQSLIGCRAPTLTMRDTSGVYVEVFGESGTEHGKDGTKPAKTSVLYFYDTGCSTCRADAAALRGFLPEKDYPIVFYAIYTGSDYGKWKEYAAAELDFGTENTEVVHLWDPEISSDYQLKYGVLTTPRIFVTDPSGVIVGRGLDPVSLAELLNILLTPETEKACVFGSPESEALYDGVFGVYGEGITCEAVDSVRMRISERCLESGDTLLFRQMTGDLMYYLASKRGAAAKCACYHLIEDEIFGRREIWERSADSLAVLPYAGILHDLIGRSQAGSALPETDIPAVMKKGKKSKEGSFDLSRQKNTVIVFHTPGCNVCKAELEAVDSLCRADRKLRFLLVDMDEVLAWKPDMAKVLFDTFDLTVMPYIISTDRKARVKERYISYEPMIFYL